MWSVSISLAGHPPALLRRSHHDELSEFGQYGTLLGIFADTTFVVETSSLRAGDVLVLHTDGVTEARRGDIFFGEDRLRDMVMKGDGTAQEIADGLVDHVLDFQEGDPRDDMAVVVLRVP